MHRVVRRLMLLALDAVLVSGAFLLAYALGLNFRLLDPEHARYIAQAAQLAGWVVALHLALFGLFHLYRGVTRYTGHREILAIVAAACVAAGALLVYSFVLERKLGQDRIPLSVIPLTWLLVVVMCGGMRYSRRLLAEGAFRGRGEGRGVLIIGTGTRGELVARELRSEEAGGRTPVGFIDEDENLKGRSIHGLKIFGGFEEIESALERTGAEEIIVALPSPTPRQMKDLADRCSRRRVSIQRLPGAAEMLEGRVALETLRPVKIEDLLAREPVELALSDEDNYLAGERALVTGAGGSIGAELCRQILPNRPEKLLMLGRGENSLYEMAAELGYRFGESRMELLLADTQDERRIEQIFAARKPTVVFHAAAHKHVPFGELAPAEVVRNNVFGTLNVARAALRHSAKRFILISTDKAVRPTNVMGASKRVAEMAVASLSQKGQTAFIAVRFGNVLGSRGSVIPLFLRQIEKGGPVTVTDPEMTRFFMTIPEASSLVLKTGAIARNGQLCVLDMGEPVRIFDLARNLIALSGFEPEKDIAIEIVGARPGEKVHEELLTRQEGLQKTRNGKIFVTTLDAPDPDLLVRGLNALTTAVQIGDDGAVRDALALLVPDFAPEDSGRSHDESADRA